jgi:hypothetical protein
MRRPLKTRGTCRLTTLNNAGNTAGLLMASTSSYTIFASVILAAAPRKLAAASLSFLSDVNG